MLNYPFLAYNSILKKNILLEKLECRYKFT